MSRKVEKGNRSQQLRAAIEKSEAEEREIEDFDESGWGFKDQDETGAELSTKDGNDDNEA